MALLRRCGPSGELVGGWGAVETEDWEDEAMNPGGFWRKAFETKEQWEVQTVNQIPGLLLRDGHYLCPCVGTNG